LYHEESKEVTECSAKKFQELTSATYCRSIIIAPGELAKRWATKEIAQDHPPVVSKFLEEEYQRYISHPPKISIGKDRSSLPHGFDVFVEEDVKTFQGVTFYGGCLENNSSNPEYLLEDVNGEKFRNLGPMINDGFPNCMCVKVNDHGFRYHFLLAIRDIKKGEKLVWNYGAGHKTKLYSPHFELNPEELKYYIQRNPIAQNFERLGRFFSTESNDCQFFLSNLAERERLSYVLETPSSMLYLLSEGLFTVEDMAVVFAQESFLFQLANLSVEQLEIRKSFVQICCGVGLFLRQCSQQGQNDLVKEIQQILLHWSISLPISLIISFSAFFMNSLKFDIKSLGNWNDFKQDLGFYVKFMESLHYYSSNVNGIKHEEYIQKMEEHFEKLSKKKKTQGLEDMRAHAVNLDIPRQKVLMEIHSRLSKSI
jgi:SET domain-containing protein